MDFSDCATHHEELMREIALKRDSNHAPALPATGECHWCGDSVPPGHRFCDADCRDMHEVRTRMERINGRKDVA